MKPRRSTLEAVLQQATHVRQRVEEVRRSLRDREVQASGADGHVTVTATCEGKIVRIDVAPALLEQEGLEMTLDVITATVNRALELADQTVDREVTIAAGGLRIPGINA